MSEFLVHSFTLTCLISGRAAALVLARGHDRRTLRRGIKTRVKFSIFSMSSIRSRKDRNSHWETCLHDQWLTKIASNSLYIPQTIFSHSYRYHHNNLVYVPVVLCNDEYGWNPLFACKIEGEGVSDSIFSLYIVKIGSFTRVLMPFLMISLPMTRYYLDYMYRYRVLELNIDNKPAHHPYTIWLYLPYFMPLISNVVNTRGQNGFSQKSLKVRNVKLDGGIHANRQRNCEGYCFL